MSTNILILAAGPAVFEANDGGYPLCLTEQNGAPLLEHIVFNTRNITDAQYAYAFAASDVNRFHMDQVANLITPGAEVIEIPANTQGAVCTAMLAASRLDMHAELLLISANELVDCDLAKVLDCFRAKQFDGGTITFRSVHPRYSYVRLNEEALVTEAAQQNPISHHATAGIFWFARTHDFLEAAKNLIRKNASTAGKFYIAPAYNELILKQMKIGVYEIPNKDYHPLKTERHMQNFEHGEYE